MPPIEKQRISGMSDLLTSRLVVEFGQFRKFNFSSISSSICAIPIEISHNLPAVATMAINFYPSIICGILYPSCRHKVSNFASLYLFGLGSVFSRDLIISIAAELEFG